MPIEFAGIKHCFVANGLMYCTWISRKTGNGQMAMLPNHSKYLKFPVKWKRRKEKDPPDLNALEVIHQKNEKTLTVQGKGSDRLM